MDKSTAFNRLKWTLNSPSGLDCFFEKFHFLFYNFYLFFKDNSKGSNENPTFDGETIHLNPMQIRTFILKLTKS